MSKILVWDWPVRVGHWLLASAFALSWVTGESEAWRLVHAYAGGTVVGIILFRMLWGFVGTHHARFTSFVRGPGAALAYLSGLLRGDESKYAGHNAAAGWAILALLSLGLLSGLSGWLVYQEMGGVWMEKAHEILSSGMLAVVLLHIAGVIISSLAHRENLVRAIFTGLKQGRPDEAIIGTRPLVLVLLIGWVAACAWWLAR